MFARALIAVGVLSIVFGLLGLAVPSSPFSPSSIGWGIVFIALALIHDGIEDLVQLLKRILTRDPPKH